MMKDLKCDVCRSVLEKKRERDDRKEREKEEEEEKGGGGIILITPPKTTQAPIDFIPPLSSHPETLYVQYGVHSRVQKLDTLVDTSEKPLMERGPTTPICCATWTPSSH